MTNKREAVIITGASSGIGKELSLKLNEMGKFVLLTGRNFEKLSTTQKLLPNPDSSGIVLLNLGKLREIKSVTEEIKKNYLIKCLVNNAGVTVFKSVDKTDESEIENIVNVNLTGTIFLTKHILTQMLENKRGKIINILSVAANTVFTKSGIYSATKAGLRAFSNVLREEVRKQNISVTNILPGATATPIWDKKSLEKHSSEMMTAADLADLIIKSVSDESSAIAEEIIVRPITGDI